MWAGHEYRLEHSITGAGAWNGDGRGGKGWGRDQCTKFTMTLAQKPPRRKLCVRPVLSSWLMSAAQVTPLRIFWQRRLQRWSNSNGDGAYQAGLPLSPKAFRVLLLLGKRSWFSFHSVFFFSISLSVVVIYPRQTSTRPTVTFLILIRTWTDLTRTKLITLIST